MINSKISRSVVKEEPQERLFKLLESIDWKLWEMYNMLKDNLPTKDQETTSVEDLTAKTTTSKKSAK